MKPKADVQPIANPDDLVKWLEIGLKAVKASARYVTPQQTSSQPTEDKQQQK